MPLQWLAPDARRRTGDLARPFACDSDPSVDSMQTTTGKYGSVAESCSPAVDTALGRDFGTSPPWVPGEIRPLDLRLGHLIHRAR